MQLLQKLLYLLQHLLQLQHLLPQHALSRVVLWATRLRWSPFKNLLIGAALFLAIKTLVGLA